MSKKHIAVLVGSMRENSYSRRIANLLIQLAPASLELEMVEIGNLPLFSEDVDAEKPQSYAEFREKIRAAEGFLFITPEHNRSLSAALKNAIDVGSVPWGNNGWNGKPGAVVSSSTGPTEGALANQAVRQTVVNLNVFMLQHPDVSLNNVNKSFDKEGNLINEEAMESLKELMKQFENWVQKF